MLEIDASQRRRQLAEVAGGRTDESAELAERPVGGGDQFGTAGDREPQAADVIGARLDAEGLGLDGSRGGAFGAVAHRVVQRTERQVTLVVGA